MRCTIGLLAAILTFGPLTSHAHAVSLVKDGKPVATIVIRDADLKAKPYLPTAGVSGDPDGKVRLAADDLSVRDSETGRALDLPATEGSHGGVGCRP